MINKKVANGIAIVVTAVWTLSFTIAAINPNYSPPSSVHTVMMIISGAAFAGSVVKKKDSDKDDE